MASRTSPEPVDEPGEPGLQLDLRLNSNAGEVAVRLVGDLDASTAPWLLARLGTPLSSAGPAVYMDLSGVAFLDVSGVRALVTIADTVRLAQGEIKIGGLRGGPLRLAKIVSLDQIVDVAQPDEQ